MPNLRALPALAAPLALLAACGGGGGGGPTGPSQTYETLQSTAAVTTPLTGMGFYNTDQVQIPYPIRTLNGTITHDTGAITLEDALVDSDGPDGSGVLAGDNPPPGMFHSGTFIVPTGYSSLALSSYLLSGGFVVAQDGVTGIATASADIPGSGSTTYSGTASGTGPNGAWTNAPGTITANFGAGTVAATTTGVVGGVTSTVAVNGMTISGSAFDGGTATVTVGGVAGDYSNWMNTSGQFYGYDTSLNGPDEVGLLMSGTGTYGPIRLTMIAD